jgi:hypothetical protein
LWRSGAACRRLGRPELGWNRRRNGELLGGVKVDGDGTSGKKMEWEKR